VSLHARQVSRAFGGVTALSAVDLELGPGEIHGLIGPNGSGKTTLLNLLCGYYRADAGRIEVDGSDLTRAPVEARANAGIARSFQAPRLLPTLSVLDNAMLGGWREVRSGFLGSSLALARARREDRTLRERAEEMLHGVGLGRVLDRPAGHLEHAEQRFLEIARALVSRPRYVLLDEPAGGLTGAEIAHLGGILQVMRGAGLGVLLVEHHTDFVFRVCDRVTTLDLGQVLAHGTPDQVRADEAVIRVYLGGGA
jgi:ABC-type branched-subunit amino acid transport system ATPase component